VGTKLKSRSSLAGVGFISDCINSRHAATKPNADNCQIHYLVIADLSSRSPNQTLIRDAYFVLALILLFLQNNTTNQSDQTTNYCSD